MDRIFRHAVRTYRAESNPAPHPEVLQAREAHPFASIKDPDQLGGLIRAIAAYHGYATVRHALMLSPLVFQRPGELRLATWMSSTSRTACGRSLHLA